MEMAGLAVSGISLMIAFWGLYASRKAQSAAEHARIQLGQNSAIADMTLASGRIDHLKELHSSRQWQRALDHYTPLRQTLQSASRRHPTLSAQAQNDFEDAIAWTTNMEDEVRDALAGGQTPDAPELNTTLNHIQVRLDQARIDLAHEYQVRGGRDGSG